MSFPIVNEQRFFKTALNELVDLDSITVKEYIKGKTLMEIAASIIKDIEYPLRLGQPDDTHIWNAFHGKWCKTINEDFWQKASETLTVKIGDCEDSSIAFVACARALGLTQLQVYEAFGYVEATTGNILGGHGWVFSKGIPDDEWRLLESTLDEEPVLYPKVANIRQPFPFNNIVYVIEELWNDKRFEEVGSLDYRKRKKREKETREKYDAIAEAWKTDTKPGKAMRKSTLHRIRRLLRRE